MLLLLLLSSVLLRKVSVCGAGGIGIFASGMGAVGDGMNWLLSNVLNKSPLLILLPVLLPEFPAACDAGAESVGIKLGMKEILIEKPCA
ncbi:MAG: hypothetical protein WAN51_08715 [Alphaproteobacteria bacterium]